jgi:hypothetical protein
VSPQTKSALREVRSRTDTDTDVAETNDAVDESPTKKKTSPIKRKSKAAAKAASEEDEAPVKSEAGESADDDA